eukprot:39685_1
MTTINQIDDAIARYYKSLRTDYNANFATFCIENAFDDETLEEELNVEPEDCLLIYFDDNFPFNEQNKCKSEDEQQTFIHNLLKQCFNNPHILFPSILIQVDTEFFNTSTEHINKISAIWKSVSQFWPGERELVQILAIGYKNNCLYLCNLADSYSRATTRLKQLTVSKWCRENNKHFEYLKTLGTMTRYDRNNHPTRIHKFVQHNLQTFFHRIMPNLQLSSPIYQINDSLQCTVSYLFAAVIFIQNLINKSSETVPLNPFQLDLCIAYDEPIKIKNQF